MEVTNLKEDPDSSVTIPHQSYARLFLRFLRFGLLAWGGPVAQIAMIKQELVEEERWVKPERFNRALAVYQVLPGPEAHELCVYFGMLARGRLGAILAGLGFMLPGFVLMIAVSWVYVTYGISSPLFAVAFAPVQAAVIAVIVRAVHRIGHHSVTDPWLWAIAIGSGIAQMLHVHFAIPLLFGGGAYRLLQQRRYAAAATLTIAFIGACGAWVLYMGGEADSGGSRSITDIEPASQKSLFGSGLKAGLLTFGGAYTVIPFLQEDAVLRTGWMTNDQFLDGLGISGILPAPLVIFATFVGYFAGGIIGASSMTLGIFLPAFSFTLLGHDFFERVIQNERIHTFFTGVTAGVVGLIGATTVKLLRNGIEGWVDAVVCAVALLILYRSKSKAAVPVVLAVAALLGLVLYLFAR